MKKTLAQQVKDIIESMSGCSYSLEAGYAIDNGKPIRLPVPTILQKSNDHSRHYLIVYRYCDDSRLLYDFNYNADKAVLTAF